MAEPFKNFFNATMIGQIGDHLARVDPGFDNTAFSAIACAGLEPLELKARSNHIRQALEKTLPDNFRESCELIIAALHPVDDSPIGDMAMDDQGIRGWPIMPIADYVAENGMQEFDYSLDVLGHLTRRFSAEFAIRHFFLKDWQRTLDKAFAWSKHDNVHLRRLASEGSRPLLPWGLKLTGFVDDPSPLLPLLEGLKNDPDEYVRRSVANNLNDIAKHHPRYGGHTCKILAGRCRPGYPTPGQTRLSHADKAGPPTNTGRAWLWQPKGQNREICPEKCAGEDRAKH